MKILTLYDYKGGAWWHRTRQIQRFLPPVIRMDVLELYTPFEPPDYDFVMLFEEYLIDAVWFVPPEKIIAGSSTLPLAAKAFEALEQGRCAGLVFNSLEMYQSRTGMHNCFCCQNGVDEELFFPSPAAPATALTACWVGNSLSKYNNKGLELIQEACARAHVELLYWDQAVSPVSRSQEWLRDYMYHKAHIYICASEYEGTPNPALEALACGLPVISTRVGNMPEIIRDGYNGYLVERSTEDIVAALRSLAGVDFSRLRANARASILDGWTWTQQADKYARMFRQLSERRAEPCGGKKLCPSTFNKEALRFFLQGNFSRAASLLLWAVKYSFFWRLARRVRYHMTGAIHHLKAR
jgi:Glycosyltransferase